MELEPPQTAVGEDHRWSRGVGGRGAMALAWGL